MADHLQQQVLEYVQGRLVAAATAASTRVYLDRVDELLQANLPALHIEGGDEEITIETIGFPALLDRQYTFTVACVVGQASGAAKAARNLAKEVEAALLASTVTFTAGGLAKALLLSGSTETKDGGGATSLFEVRQSWLARYITQGGAPDVPL